MNYLLDKEISYSLNLLLVSKLLTIKPFLRGLCNQMNRETFFLEVFTVRETYFLIS